jgi:hypothetical protein
MGILQNLTGKPISLDDYASRKYLPDESSHPGLNPGGLDDLRSQRYTSMVDLQNHLSAVATSGMHYQSFRDSRYPKYEH